MKYLFYLTYLSKRLMLELWMNILISGKQEQISFIIPTIWRSSMLEQLVQQLSKSELVGEIIIIDNMGEGGRNLTQIDKVRVHNSPENLLVNPSWNLGVQLARFDKVALCNDDIIFDTSILKDVSRVMNKKIGLIGVDKECFKNTTTKSPWFRYVVDRAFPFGVLIFFRKENYVAIPEELKIWCGDDFLFDYVKGPHFAIKGVSIKTQMSSSSGSEEFRKLKQLDVEIYNQFYKKTSKG